MPDGVISRALRPGLVCGPSPEEDGTWLVLDPDSGNVYELSEVVWLVAEALDGEQTAAELAESLDIGRRHVQDVLRRLEDLGLLVDAAERDVCAKAVTPPPQWRRGPVPERFDLVVHPEARFQCVGVGICCDRGYVIPVHEDQVEGLRAAARARGRGERDPVTLWPAEPGEAWGYALDNDEGCPFHAEDAGCSIHEQPEQPDACQVFPLVFARVGSSVIVSQSYRCGCGIGADGPRLVDQGEELARRLCLSPHIPAVPETVALDGRRTVSGASAVQIFLGAAARAEDDPWGAIEQALQELLRASEPSGELPESAPSLPALRAALEAVATDALAVVLRGGAEISADALTARLAPRGLTAEPDGDGELARFVRDHVFGLRPLQQATLTHGVALLAALLDGAWGEGLDTVAARARLMAWDDLIPQTEVRGALAALGHPLTEDAAALLVAVREAREGA